MIYKLVLALRNLMYDKGWKKSHEAHVPTVCVGNITVGGTGKTPHTEMILRQKTPKSSRMGPSRLQRRPRQQMDQNRYRKARSRPSPRLARN